jgi:hypothetical protein
MCEKLWTLPKIEFKPLETEATTRRSGLSTWGWSDDYDEFPYRDPPAVGQARWGLCCVCGYNEKERPL